MKKRMMVIALCLVLLVVSVLTGCQNNTATTSDNQDNSSTSQDSSGDKKSTEAGGTYTFGVAAPITGNYAEYGKGFQVATQMAVDKLNAAGGINGKTFELKLMDSKGDPKESAEIARKFSQDDDILAVVGDFTSSSCMAASPIYEEVSLVQLSPTASHPDYAAMGPYMFGIMGRQDAEGPFVAKYLAKKFLGTEKLGVIYINNDWGLSAQKNVVKTAEEIGIDVTVSEAFFEGEKDFTASLTKIRQTNPDTIVLVMMYNEVVIISKQIKQMGWDVKVAALGPGYSQQILDLGGKDVEGLTSSTPFIIEESDSVAMEFAKEFEKLAGFQPNVHAASAYDAVMLLANSIKNSETVDRKSIRDALEATDGFVGITGPIKFNPAGDVNKKYRIISVTDGQWKIETGYDYYDE